MDVLQATALRTTWCCWTFADDQIRRGFADEVARSTGRVAVWKYVEKLSTEIIVGSIAVSISVKKMFQIFPDEITANQQRRRKPSQAN